jgi:ankyrin repeat protein
LEVVKFLLANGADTSLVNSDGWSALHWAASHGGVPVLELLVAHGANLLQEDNSGRLPIDIARQYGKGDHVAYLKRQRA